MDWFKFHIRPYLDATEHLTLAEHGAYLRLLLAAYKTAKPLPSDLRRVFKIVSASTTQERRSTESVLKQFWILSDDGWTNPKVVEVLDDFRVRSERNRKNASEKGASRPASRKPVAKPLAPVSPVSSRARVQSTDSKSTGTRRGTSDRVPQSKSALAPNSVDPNDVPAYTPSQALGDFNALAIGCGLSQARNLSPQRRTAMRRRLVECGGSEGWLAILDHIQASPFLQGQNDRGWKLTLDWLLKAQNFTKVAEGQYAHTAPPSKTDEIMRNSVESTERVMEHLRQKGEI